MDGRQSAIVASRWAAVAARLRVLLDVDVRPTRASGPTSGSARRAVPSGRGDDGEALRTNIVANINAYLHPTSSVPMGAESDPTAVVDAWGKVRGIEGLRVVDASIIPEIPSSTTNVTTIMVAERIATALSASHNSAST